MMFPDNSGFEIEVEYDADPELYSSGINVESVLATAFGKHGHWFTDLLSEHAIKEIEGRINAVLHA